MNNDAMTVKPIGGYFELEIPLHFDNMPHSDGVLVNSCRHALEYILKGLKISKLYVAYYTCDVVIQPLERLGIPYAFYHIDENLEIVEDFKLESDEYILYTNYYGIKDAYINKISQIYIGHIILDCAQALFAPAQKGIMAGYSPRKYVGVPDGGIAVNAEHDSWPILNKDLSYDRCSHLLKRIDLGSAEGYADFRNNSRQITESPLMQMSELTKAMLSAINFETVKERRRNNFAQLHDALRATNKMQMPSPDTFACPMVYPYLTDDTSLRQRLIEKKVFVATYWPNVLEWAKEDELEYKLTKNLIPLPIDQRYDSQDMERIINIILDIQC